MSEQRRTLARQQLAATIKRMRNESSLNQTQVGEAIGLSNQQIANIESGRTGLKAEHMRKLLDLFQVADEDERLDLMHRATVSRERAGKSQGKQIITGSSFVAPVIRRFYDMEDEASEEWIHAPLHIPAMLQTSDYARGMNRWYARRDAKSSDKHVQLRIARQGLLARKPQPLRLWAILGEAALHIVIGSPETLLEQLQHIYEIIRKNANITVQVLPFNAGNSPLGHANVRVLRHPLAPMDMVYVEGADWSGRILDREEDIERTLWQFDEARAVAESPDRSLQLIDRQIKHLKEIDS